MYILWTSFNGASKSSCFCRGLINGTLEETTAAEVTTPDF